MVVSYVEKNYGLSYMLYTEHSIPLPPLEI